MSRILIVDDDRDTCAFIESLIAGSGREIVSASTPDEAIAAIRDESLDVLISDINLNAAQTGLDLLRAFKARHPAGQVILISGLRHAGHGHRGDASRRVRLHQQAVRHRRGQANRRAGAGTGRPSG